MHIPKSHPCGSSTKPAEHGQNIVVIGAGIIGVCIAYQLALRGENVIVLDSQQPGSGCTQGAFAMLIASHADANDAKLNSLYGLAMKEWKHLEEQLDEDLPVQWGGMVHWTQPGAPAEAHSTMRARLHGWGAQAEALNLQDMARIAPGVSTEAFGTGTFLPDHGAVDIEEVFGILLRRAKNAGVRFQTPVHVSGIRTRGRHGKHVVVTDDGLLEASKIVLAAGAGIPALAQSIGVHVPLHMVSGTLAYSKPMPPVLQRVLNGPKGSIRQNPDGCIVTGLDYAPGADGEDVSDAYGDMLLKKAADVVPALAGMELNKMVLGHVPIPIDTKPIVGFCDKDETVYIATMMSGITMAPLMGRLVADEILGQRVTILGPYRPTRFATPSAL